jgi:hypothetical protein
MNGNIEIGEPTMQRVLGSSTGVYPAWMVPIMGWYALQFGSYVTDAVRLANFDAGSNTVDDDALYGGLQIFPSGRQPNFCFMNRRSLEQLRDSRTATNATGAPAPRPTEIEGIPIVVTDGLLITETAVT